MVYFSLTPKITPQASLQPLSQFFAPLLQKISSKELSILLTFPLSLPIRLSPSPPLKLTLARICRWRYYVFLQLFRPETLAPSLTLTLPHLTFQTISKSCLVCVRVEQISFLLSWASYSRLLSTRDQITRQPLVGALVSYLPLTVRCHPVVRILFRKCILSLFYAWYPPIVFHLLRIKQSPYHGL